jgi:hypothetical protein
VERGLPKYKGACESLPTPNSAVEGERAAKRQVKSALRIIGGLSLLAVVFLFLFLWCF